MSVKIHPCVVQNVNSGTYQVPTRLSEALKSTNVLAATNRIASVDTNHQYIGLTEEMSELLTRTTVQCRCLL